MNSQLLPDKTYHLGATCSDGNLFFSNDQDYLLFLKLYKENISSIASTLSFCLIPNEFQLIIKINTEQDLFNYYKQNDFFPDEKESLESIKKLNQSLSSQNFNVFDKHNHKLFINFLNAFVSDSKNQKQLAFNKIAKSGFSKTELIEENDLVSVITTVHQLPVKYKVCKQIPDWKYSSYQAILSEKPSNINREFVLSLFESREKFISTVNNTNKIAEIEI